MQQQQQSVHETREAAFCSLRSSRLAADL